MLKHYLLFAARTLRRHKAYTAINLVGLAVAVVCGLSVYALVAHERGFDAHHAQAERTYRVGALWPMWLGEGPSYQEQTPTGLVPVLREGVPGIERVVEVQVAYGTGSVKAGGAFFDQDRRAYVGPEFFEAFSYAVVSGGVERLGEPGTVVLAEATARRYFGDADAVGEVVRVGQSRLLDVVGVVADPPAATHLPFVFFESLATLERAYDEWSFSDGHSLYVVLTPGTAPADVLARLNAIREAHQAPEERAAQTFLLQPLRAIHTDTRFGPYPGGYVMDPVYLWGLVLLGLLIVLSAAVNHINLAAARGAARAREIGVRKALGGTPARVAAQLMGEVGVLTLGAAALGWTAALAALPHVGRLFEIGVGRAALLRPEALLATLALALVLGACAGLYPSVVLARLQPAVALRGRGRRASGIGLRRGLIVFQFVATQALVLGTFVVLAQMRYAESKDLGFEREARVLVTLPGDEGGRAGFREALRRAPAVEHVTFAMGGPARDGRLSQRYTWAGVADGEGQSLRTLPIDAEYVAAFGLTVLAGRGLLPEDETGARGRAALINEAMARRMGAERPAEAVGVRLSGENWDGERYELEVVGVVQDFHHGSLRSGIDPVVLQVSPDWVRQAGVTLAPGRTAEGLAQAEAAFAAAFPDTHFRYTFLDAYLDGLYQSERRVAAAFRVLAGLAALIAALGLFGLTALAAAQRTKEIGVRKVLGASVGSLVALLSREVVGMVGAAFVIAAPLAILVMGRWLDGFAYRVALGPGLVAAVGASAVGLALLATAHHTLRAATADPVQSLRSE